MKYSKTELVTGVFVLAGLAAVAFLALRVGAGALFGADTYPLRARFANVSGLNAGAPVVVSGVTVGRVEAIALQPDFSAEVTLQVRRELQLPSDSIVSVKTSGLIGDKFLAIAPGAEDDIVPPGALLTETESTVDLESLISRFAFGGVNSSSKPAPAATAPGTTEAAADASPAPATPAPSPTAPTPKP